MKRRFAAFYLAWIFGGLFAATAQNSADRHTFTGPNGVTLEAEILDFADRKVVIRRLSDGQTFELAANRLAPADVAFMRNWLERREAARHPLGWKRFQVHLPEFSDEVEAPGIPSAFRRTGLHTWEAELPEGAWIAVKLSRQPGSDFGPQFLLPFSGEREWFLSYEEARLFRSVEPRGEKTLIGITILPEDGERELRALKKELPAGGAAIYSGFVDGDDLSILGSGVLSVTVKKLRDFSAVGSAGIRALRVTEAINEFEGLAGCNALEMLDVPHSGDYPLAICAGLKSLTTLIADGELNLESASGDGSFPALRCLSLRGAGIADPESFPDFVSKLENLQSLSLPDEAVLQLGALAGCAELTAIDLGDECRDPGAAGLGALKHLTTALLNATCTPADLAALMKVNALAKVRTLRTNQRIDLEKLPRIRTLILQGNRDGADFSKRATPPTLTHLRVLGATDADLAALGTAGPNLGIQFLSLRLLNGSNLAPLKTLSRLEFLSLEDQYVTSDQKLTAFDLAPFPGLRGLRMVQLQNLAGMTIPENSKLEALSVKACGKLAGIDSPPISSLREIVISNCGVLSSIGGLAGEKEGAIRRFTGTPRLK